jgi:hypothetical protein
MTRLTRGRRSTPLLEAEACSRAGPLAAGAGMVAAGGRGE